MNFFEYRQRQWDGTATTDDLDLSLHDRRFHHDHYDPSRMFCSLRQQMHHMEEEDQHRHHMAGGTGADAEAKRQYDEVVARYTNLDGTKKPGWMKAPNGKPTKLTERQWVQVRTPNFKRWFGDWELANLLHLAKQAWGNKDFVDKVEFLPSDELAKALKDELGNEVDTIVITADAIRHVQKQHGDSVSESNRGQVAMTPEDIAVLPFVLNEFDAVKRMPQFDDKMGNKSIDFYKRINGVSVVATISKGPHKQFVVTGWKVLSAAAMPHDVTLRLNALSDADTNIVQKRIAEIKGEAKDSSKIVDENGEPLVMYNGGWEGNVFLGNAWFTDNKAVAEQYANGGNTEAFFISAPDAVVIDAKGNNFNFVDGRRSTEEIAYEEDEKNGKKTVVFKNIHDEFSHSAPPQIVVSHRGNPEQVKSATHNDGVFSETDPNINH